MIERIVHVRRDRFDAYVGRRMAGLPTQHTYFGNPFRLPEEHARGSTLSDYLGYLLAHPELVERARYELAPARVIACWCAPHGGLAVDDDLHCHAQILARAIRGDYEGYYLSGAPSSTEPASDDVKADIP